MSQGSILIFDESSLKSLNLDELALLNNFCRSNTTLLLW